MATYFSYKGINNITNKIVRGRIEAPDEFALEHILNESAVILISAKEIKQSKLSLFVSRFTSKITAKELISLFITLEQLERAGVPLLESIKDLKDSSENIKMKDLMQDIYENVKSGSLLSAAMAKHNNIFDEVVVSLIAMGEKTGQLSRAFKSIYDNMKWNLEIKKKVSKAVTGPTLSMLLLIIIAVVLLKVVVPKVLGFILEQEIPIPAYTTALIKTSDFIENYFLFLIGGMAGLIFLFKFLRKFSLDFKIATDQMKLKMPIMGSIMQKIDLSRFAKFFGMTFNCGIPILDCLSISSNTIVNSYIKNEIDVMRQKVSDGRSLGKSIAESPVFPFIVVRMFKVGEDSGNIEVAMENIDYFYESEINDGIEMVIASIKPAILFLMGGLMCWIIAAVFGPIYGNFANMV